ncbi:trypsin-like peptidase domain-containing protein [Neolewinella persica]|uniref:trypsin-like peptidase domain-containing protein n=1 Tax=Neolewinella persica TaxID=70998 RepID=UPI00036A346E|nr:trypsin-like peptidase domain-containing protein [Neolewinella persica]
MKPTDLLILITCCLLTAALTVAGTYLFLVPAVAPSNAAAEGMINPRLEDLRLRTFTSSSPTNFIAAAEGVTPAVVSIRCFGQRTSRVEPNAFVTTTGSGVIIDADGLIATNNHVIEGAERIRVLMEDKREFDAEVIGVDESTDLALLRIRPSGKLPTLTFGNSDSLRVGEWVLAVGNPFSLNSTVTAGIVSAKGRSIDVLEAADRIESFIQSDAAVNPGNSGGALVNTNGELVGINTAILTNSGRHEGFAFAIPGNLASRVLQDLQQFGEVKRARLGVYIQAVNDAQAKRLGLKSATGVLITNLTPNGAALRAGLEVGDVMTALNGVAISSAPEMQEQLSRYRPGQKIRVSYIRNGRKRSATALLRDKANRTKALVSHQEDDLLHQLGFEVRSLTEQEASLFPKSGVYVMSIFRNSPIEATNMNVGFVISEVNGQAIRTLAEFMVLLGKEGELLFKGSYEGYEGDYYYRVE